MPIVDEPSPQSTADLRRDAIRIWQAGVEAVRPERLVPEWLRVEGQSLVLGSPEARCPRLNLPLDAIRRIVVVGAGKAGEGMARAVEAVLGPALVAEKQLTGWVNVPASGASWQVDNLPHRNERVGETTGIHLHPARPAGANEPTPEGVAGSIEILRLVESLGPEDLCLCLLSGGGSALMPAPAEGLSLADKVAVTRCLSAAGANIEQLNTVRKQLSRIKGGGLLRACRGGRLVTLVISDVLGDRPDLIASGPTAPDLSTPQQAIDILEQFHARQGGVAPIVFDYLRRKASLATLSSAGERTPRTASSNELRPDYLILANNGTAVEAAGREARRLGYSTTTESASQCEGAAEQVGRRLAERALAMCRAGGRACLVSGGEPIVMLAEPSRRGHGGRNQQLVLASLLRFSQERAASFALLSGGTDGEDGPTDAAGALCDATVLAAAGHRQLDAGEYLARNDAYHFFAMLDALLKTGPTGTNVCDLRVVLTRS
ncbi:MAG: DUF4147 domain-containing protein [Thermoguttaceae bacterium]